jgi:beta-N-acetylhexosaminidase
MGINVLLGPSVDVLNTPRPAGKGDVGIRTFGGDPWWVGQMGRAYVRGVHTGSNGRVATVAKHFPGHGGSDRLPDEEVATVDKSLQELKRIELAPFFAITEAVEEEDPAVTDALMSSHIRYRGFQGDIRQFTVPISFDPQSMGEILSLPELASWRRTGVMVSDSLGVPAVRKYFDPSLTTFPHRRIAKEALLAGNDLLILAQFALDGGWGDQLANIQDTIRYFRDEYRRNAVFAARVDDAVERIVRLKRSLYPDWGAATVMVDPATALEVCGQGGAVVERIARQALTLLFPDPSALPAPPGRTDDIVIVTDARQVRECFTDACQPSTPLSPTAVQEAMIRIYGPDTGSGQVDPARLTSLDSATLKRFLSQTLDPAAGDPDVGGLLEQAEWIVFAMQDFNPERSPNSDAVRLFLDQAAGLPPASDAQLAVLAFNAPYYLDTTEISKLSYYLAAYSKTVPFVEAAVRALFGELTPQGAPPVDVDGINYDLLRQLSPDPEQTIDLVQLAPESGTSLSPPISVLMRAGPILDRNAHPVPDGTLVTFRAEYSDQVRYVPPRSATTADGYAEASFELTEPGSVEFSVASGDATRSRVVRFQIAALPTSTAAPTGTPTATPTPTPTSTHTPTPSPSPSPTPTTTLTPTPTATPVPAASAGRLGGGGDLLLAWAGTLLAALVTVPWTRVSQFGRRRLLRGLLLALSGGMTGYLLYALGWLRPQEWEVFPDAAWVPWLAVTGLAFVVALVPALVHRWVGGKP